MCSDESQQCDSGAQSSSECNAHTIVPYPACICSDVQVQPDMNNPGAPLFTCAQEYNNGNCGQAFLKDTVDTIPEGGTSTIKCNLLVLTPPHQLWPTVCTAATAVKLLYHETEYFTTLLVINSYDTS